MTKREKAWYMIGGSIAFLIALLVLKQSVTPTPVCDPKIKSKTVILLDHSESISKQTADVIVERTWKHIEENVPAGELITVYEITKLSKTNLQPSFEGCKPRAQGSQYVENVKKVERDFQNFKVKLREDLSTPIKNTSGPVESPIAQALIDMSLDDKHFRSEDVTKLLVFSDLLEYTPKFSLYKSTSADQAIKDFRASRSGSVERPSFKHVEVQLHVIPRSIPPQTVQSRDKFWVWFFGDNAGSCKKESCLSRDDLPGSPTPN